MAMDLQPKGRWKEFTILNVRAWMRVWHKPGQSVKELAQSAGEAFGVWDLLGHLHPEDHWVYNLAAAEIERHQGEVAACRAFFETQDLLDTYLKTGRVPAELLK